MKQGNEAPDPSSNIRHQVASLMGKLLQGRPHKRVPMADALEAIDGIDTTTSEYLDGSTVIEIRFEDESEEAD